MGALGPAVCVFWSVDPVGEHASLSLCFLKAIPGVLASQQGRSWHSHAHSLGGSVFKIENAQADVLCAAGRSAVKLGFWLVTGSATEVVIVMWN